MKLINCHHIKKRPPSAFGCLGPKYAQQPDGHLNSRDRRSASSQSQSQSQAKSKAQAQAPATLNACKLRRSKCFSQLSAGQLLPLSLMCLIIISDFQQQIANQCAQSIIKEEEKNQYNQLVCNNNSNSNNHQNYQQQVQVKRQYLATIGSDRQPPKPQKLCQRADTWRPRGLIMFAAANSDANRLYEDLMMTYNRIVRPVQNNSDRVVVKLSLKLSQLIDVEWSDYKLKWDPSEYGGIEDINLPAEQIWLPDIVLYNSAEGYFAVSIMTKAKVRYDGYVTWNPPAIFRSSCQIDITYFPFDSQNCSLKFGSWTFGTKIDLRHINDTESIDRGTDLSEYYQNVEWDIMQASARRNVITYNCCPNDFYPDVTFNFILRRKPLFYTVNLILPCIGITILSFLVFYLPSDSGEKVTLTISILISLIFFLSVLIETIPSTSLAMPLLGKYLVFTMILITVSVCATVCVLNIHFRTPSTHSMPPWVKRWCVDILPGYLFMNVPQYQSQQANILPEQLIYMHNQAYTSQAASTNWSTEKPAAQTTKVTNESSLANTKNHQHSIRQLNPCSLELDSSKLYSNQPSSLLLPYLQSEAARRLQIQRSRSSERDNRNVSGEYQTTASTFNNCDDRESKPLATAIDMKQEISDKRERHKKGDNKNDKLKIKLQNKDHKRKGSFWRPFNTKSINFSKENRDNERLDSELRVSEPRLEGQTVANRLATLQHDTSSSFENDYQYHNHFQARASICSNNLWRIGPTRRCSMAVPNNYPSYYQPLAQLAQQQQQPGHISTLSGRLRGNYHIRLTEDSGSEDNSNEKVPTTAVGALVASASSSLIMRPKQVAANGFATDRQQPVSRSTQPELLSHVRVQHLSGNGQVMKQLSSNRICSSQLPYTASHQSIVYPIERQANFSNMPTPPSPLTSNLATSGSNPGQMLMNHPTHLREQRQQQILSQIQTVPQTSGVISSNTASLYKDEGNMKRAEVNSGNSYNSNYRLDNYAACQPFSLSTAKSIMQQSSGQSNSSNLNQSRYHVHLNENSSLVNGFPINQNVPPTYGYLRTPSTQFQQFVVPSNSNLHIQYQAPVNQFMPRSRSTDHRLCSRDVPDSYSPSQEMPKAHPRSGSVLQTSQGIYQKQSLDRLNGAQSLCKVSVSPMQQQINTGTGDNYFLQNSHTIGRALGQAYMQRLQRQSTIYSLHSNTQRPSRTMQRGTAYLRPLDIQHRHHNHQQQQLQLTCQNSSFEKMRRSKSQTSLDVGSQFIFRTDCEQCNSLRRAESRSQLGVSKSHSNNGCQCDLNNQELVDTVDCNRVSSGASLRCRSKEFYYCECCNTSMNHDKCVQSNICTSNESKGTNGCRVLSTCHISQSQPPPLTTLGLMKLISEVDKAIQNAMFIAQHIDNLDEFESVKENWKYIAMVIDRIFLIVFLFACIVGTVTIFAMVPWSYYTTEKPIDLQLTRLMALNLTGSEPYLRSCREF